MKTAIQGRSGFSTPTETYNFGSATETVTRAPCPVIQIGVDDRIDRDVPVSLTSIDEVVAKSEGDALRLKYLQEARAELATSLESDGVTVRTLRLRHGLSQAKLGEMIGTSQPHIARIERGTENVTIETCRKLARVLSVDMNTLDAALRLQEQTYIRRMDLAK